MDKKTKNQPKEQLDKNINCDCCDLTDTDCKCVDKNCDNCEKCETHCTCDNSKCKCDKQHCVSIEELEKIKTDSENKIKSFENDYKRALADYANLKNRTEEDKINLIKFANEVLIEKVINIYNDLEESLKHVNSENHKEITVGIDKIIDKFKLMLDSEGVTQIDPTNQEFDPKTMEAIESINGDKNKVIKVYRKGYKLNDKVIITAMVAVGNGES